MISKLIIMMMFVSPCFGVEPALASNKETIITSDKLVIDQEKKTADFQGHVIAIQENTTIKSDRMIAYYSNQQSNNIDKISAIGNVVIIDGLQTATGDFGEYNIIDEIMELRGSVVLTKNNDVLKGDKIIYNMKTGHSTIFSDNDKKTRVKAIFNPKNKK